MQVIYFIIGAGIVSASISFTVTMSALFAGFRNAVEKRSKFFGDLVQCPYCFGHYVALVLNSLLFFSSDSVKFDYNNIYNYILFIFTWFLIVGIMALCHKPILTAYDPVMKIKAQKNLDKLKAEKEKEKNSQNN